MVTVDDELWNGAAEIAEIDRQIQAAEEQAAKLRGRRMRAMERLVAPFVGGVRREEGQIETAVRSILQFGDPRAVAEDES